jgi:hypothetical protein
MTHIKSLRKSLKALQGLAEDLVSCDEDDVVENPGSKLSDLACALVGEQQTGTRARLYNLLKSNWIIMDDGLIDDPPNMFHVEVACAVIGNLLTVERTSGNEHVLWYHDFLEHILRPEDGQMELESYLVKDILDFTTVPYDTTVFQLCSNIRKMRTKGPGMKFGISSLIGLAAIRDGLVLPTETKLLKECRNLYFKSGTTGLLDQDAEIAREDPVKIFNKLHLMIEWIFKWYASEDNMLLIRSRVQFVAWFGLLVFASRWQIFPELKPLLDHVQKQLTRRLKNRILI